LLTTNKAHQQTNKQAAENSPAASIRTISRDDFWKTFRIQIKNIVIGTSASIVNTLKKTIKSMTPITLVTPFGKIQFH
jgi:hypothetical protein